MNFLEKMRWFCWALSSCNVFDISMVFAPNFRSLLDPAFACIDTYIGPTTVARAASIEVQVRNLKVKVAVPRSLPQDLTSWNNPRDSFSTCPSLPLLSCAARWTQDCGLAKKTWWRERLNGTSTILICFSLSLPWLWCASDLFRTIAQSCMLHLFVGNFEYAAGAQNKQCNNVIRKKYWDDPIPGTSII